MRYWAIVPNFGGLNCQRRQRFNTQDTEKANYKEKEPDWFTLKFKTSVY